MDKFCDDFKNMLRESTLHITRERHFVLSEQMFKLIKLKGSIITLRKLVERFFWQSIVNYSYWGQNQELTSTQSKPTKPKIAIDQVATG